MVVVDKEEVINNVYGNFSRLFLLFSHHSTPPEHKGGKKNAKTQRMVYPGQI